MLEIPLDPEVERLLADLAARVGEAPATIAQKAGRQGPMMRASDFFFRLSATFVVLGLAVVGAEAMAGASPETGRATVVVFGSIIGVCVVLWWIAAIWEWD